jgi:hypothetical protein
VCIEVNCVVNAGNGNLDLAFEKSQVNIFLNILYVRQVNIDPALPLLVSLSSFDIMY